MVTGGKFMSKFMLYSVVLVAACAVLVSCGTTRSVSRVSADTQIDLSGRWNDTDSQMTAQAMVDDSLRRPWLADFSTKNKKKPVVIVGAIRNRSEDHIDASVFSKDIERELINSGKVTFVANAQEREGIRSERMDQQMEADPATIKRLGKETGADFFLQGIITSTADAVEGQKVILYKVDLELINIESNEKVWIGSKSIKKFIEQSKYRL